MLRTKYIDLGLENASSFKLDCVSVRQRHISEVNIFWYFRRFSDFGNNSSQFNETSPSIVELPYRFWFFSLRCLIKDLNFCFGWIHRSIFCTFIIFCITIIFVKTIIFYSVLILGFHPKCLNPKYPTPKYPSLIYTKSQNTHGQNTQSRASIPRW